MTNPYTAREAGTTLSMGVAKGAEFPQMVGLGFDGATAQLTEMFDDTETGVFHLDQQFMPGLSRRILKAELTHIPEHDKTREESIHSVKFGQLLLKGRDEGENSFRVAIKPFKEMDVAAREYTAGSHIAAGNVADCDTFRPLGITRLPDGTIATLTRDEHSVRSMDTIFWNPEVVLNRAIVNKALGRAGASLAILHDSWAHGDFQVKNSVWDVLRPRTTAFVADLEKSQPLKRLTPDEQLQEKYMDIDYFATSVFLLEEDPDINLELPEDLPDRIKSRFGKVYLGMQKQSAQRNASIDAATISEIVDNVF